MAHETVRDFVNWEDVAECDDIVGAGKDFDTAVSNLLENIEEKFVKSFPNHRDMILSLVAGRKFVKVVHDNSVWGFVAKVNGLHKGEPYEVGDVFKAASWKSPAKYVRGSIFDSNTDWYHWTGPNYLK